MWVNGYGFPAWRGGPMYWALHAGLDRGNPDAKRLAQAHGERWGPAPLLVRAAREGRWDFDEEGRRVALAAVGGLTALAVTRSLPIGRGPPPAAIAYTAAMQGRKAATLAAVQRLADSPQSGTASTRADCGWGLTPEYAALLRFGLWDEMIAVQPPDARLPGLTAGFLYGRSFALAARGRFVEAQASLADLAALGAAVPPQARAGANSLQEVIGLAQLVVAARLAASAGHNEEAAQLLSPRSPPRMRSPPMIHPTGSSRCGSCWARSF